MKSTCAILAAALIGNAAATAVTKVTAVPSSYTTLVVPSSATFQFTSTTAITAGAANTITIEASTGSPFVSTATAVAVTCTATKKTGTAAAVKLAAPTSVTVINGVSPIQTITYTLNTADLLTAADVVAVTCTDKLKANAAVSVATVTSDATFKVSTSADTTALANSAPLWKITAAPASGATVTGVATAAVATAALVLATLA